MLVVAHSMMHGGGDCLAVGTLAILAEPRTSGSQKKLHKQYLVMHEVPEAFVRLIHSLWFTLVCQ